MSNVAKLTWTGVAIESPSGTGATAPTMYIPVTSKFQRKTKYVYSKEERGTRDVNNVRKGTTRMSTGSLQGDVYINSIPYLLYLHMGAVASSQPDNVNAPTAYGHALTLADIPPSATFFKGYDHSGYSFAYSVVDKIKIKWSADGKLLEHDTSVQAQYGVKVSGAPYTAINDPEYDDYDSFAGYAPTIKLNNVASNIVSEMEIELTQKISLYYSSRGNRGFYKVDFGDREAKVSFTARFDDTSWEDKEENDTRDHLNIEFDGKTLGGTISEKIIFDFPIVGYDEIDVDTSGEAIEVKAKCTVIPGPTKNSLYTASVVNETASYAS